MMKLLSTILCLFIANALLGQGEFIVQIGAYNEQVNQQNFEKINEEVSFYKDYQEIYHYFVGAKFETKEAAQAFANNMNYNDFPNMTVVDLGNLKNCNRDCGDKKSIGYEARVPKEYQAPVQTYPSSNGQVVQNNYPPASNQMISTNPVAYNNHPVTTGNNWVTTPPAGTQIISTNPVAYHNYPVTTGNLVAVPPPGAVIMPAPTTYYTTGNLVAAPPAGAQIISAPPVYMTTAPTTPMPSTTRTENVAYHNFPNYNNTDLVVNSKGGCSSPQFSLMEKQNFEKVRQVFLQTGARIYLLPGKKSEELRCYLSMRTKGLCGLDFTTRATIMRMIKCDDVNSKIYMIDAQGRVLDIEAEYKSIMNTSLGLGMNH